MKFPRIKPAHAAILTATVGLAACNENNDSGIPQSVVTPAATRTVTIAPSLGRISNARVVLRNAAVPTQTLGSQPLDGGGRATFRIPASVPAVVAELVPGAGTQYYDEGVPDNPATPAVNESMQPFPVGQTLRVAFNAAGASQTVGMTALTEAAFRRARELAGSDALTAAQINLANAYVQNVFGVGNILQAPVIIGSLDDYRNLLNAAAASRDYAMRLAALAQQARQNLPAGTEAPALAMMNALAEDLRDGQLNSAGANIPYDFNAFLTAWRTAMSQLLTRIVGAIGNGAGGLTQAQIDSLTTLFNQLATNLQVNPNPGGGGGGGGAAVPIRTVQGIAEYACADEPKLKSASGPTFDLDFVNNSGASRNIFWLNTVGTRISYKTGLASGSTYHQNNTYVTHPWVVTDASGQCKGIYVGVSAGNKTITFNADGSSTFGGAGGGGGGGTAGTCESNGADNVIGFKDAPDDFCSFTRSTSSALSSPDIYTFQSADSNKRFLKVTVVNNVLQSVLLENNDYSFMCGIGALPACQNTVFTTNGGIRQFSFANTVLTAGDGSGKTLTLKDGNVIHQMQDANQPLRTENGVEIYDCAVWKKLPNGAATENVALNFVNQRGNFKSVSIYGINSINRDVLLFGGLQNDGTRIQPALHNQMVMVDNNAGQCLVVLKAITGGDKKVTLNSNDSVTISAVVAPPPAGGKTCVGNTNPRGCLTITGDGALEGAFEHIGTPALFGGGPQVQLNGNPVTSGAITFFGSGVAAASTNNGVSVGFQNAFGSTDNATYTFQQFDASLTLMANFGYQCIKDAGNDCPGLSVDVANRRITFVGVVMQQKDNMNGGVATGKTAIFNGTLNF